MGSIEIKRKSGPARGKHFTLRWVCYLLAARNSLSDLAVVRQPTSVLTASVHGEVTNRICTTVAAMAAATDSAKEGG